MSELKQEILAFLNSKQPKLCSLSTVCSTSQPESAIMGYAVLPDLTIIMSTDNTSRKWKNLKTNQKVSLVFGWTFEELNVQYEGAAELLEKGPEFEKGKALYFAAHPEAAEFKDLPETVYLKITPVWLRLSDYSSDPPRIIEE